MKQIALLALLLLTSCTFSYKQSHVSESTYQTQDVETSDNEAVNVALNFINAYINIEDSKNEWFASCDMVTTSLKEKFKKMIDDAWEEDPEMGLGYDPILDAQDYPDEGFELSSYDEKEGYIFLKGKNEEQFTVTIKVVKQNGKWLVDGSGHINIPKELMRKGD